MLAVIGFKCDSLRKRCPYSDLFWSESGKIRSKVKTNQIFRQRNLAIKFVAKIFFRNIVTENEGIDPKIVLLYDVNVISDVTCLGDEPLLGKF